MFSPQLVVSTHTLIVWSNYFLWIVKNRHVNLRYFWFIVLNVKSFMWFALIELFVYFLFKLNCCKWKLQNFLFWMFHWHAFRYCAYCSTDSMSLRLYLIRVQWFFFLFGVWIFFVWIYLWFLWLCSVKSWFFDCVYYFLLLIKTFLRYLRFMSWWRPTLSIWLPCQILWSWHWINKEYTRSVL